METSLRITDKHQQSSNEKRNNITHIKNITTAIRMETREHIDPINEPTQKSNISNNNHSGPSNTSDNNIPKRINRQRSTDTTRSIFASDPNTDTYSRTSNTRSTSPPKTNTTETNNKILQEKQTEKPVHNIFPDNREPGTSRTTI